MTPSPHAGPGALPDAAVSPSTSPEIRRVVIIGNPISGRGRTARALPALQHELRRVGVDAQIRLTAKAGDARRFATQIEGFDAAVAVGGDGTINEVVNGLPLTPATFFAVFPTGTANVLAKEFRLPRTAGQFAQMFVRPAFRWLDLGQVAARRFALFAGIGLDGKITHILSQTRRSTISMLHYVRPTFSVLWNFDAPRLTVIADGTQLTDRGSYCLIANVRSYGGPFEIASHADPSDGLLDVYVTLGTHRRDMLRYFWSSLVGRLHDHHDVLHTRAREIAVAAPAAPFQVDGDYAGAVPAVFHVLPRALPLLCPPGDGS
jgi:diacylglycerol kinase (ATP)